MSGSNNYIGKGISVTTGFDVKAQIPLDLRTVVDTLDDLNALPKDIIYLGLLVYVAAENKLYQYKYTGEETEEGEKIIGWGPIEAEVSARELISEDILDEITFEEVPPLMMQKNKKDFFPIVHEDYIYIGTEGKQLSDKYQTLVDESLKEITESGSIVDAIKTLDTQMDDKISEFEAQFDKIIENIENSANEQVAAEIDRLTQLINEKTAEIDAKTQEINDKISEINDLITQTKKEINDLKEEAQETVDGLRDDIQGQIDEMKGDLVYSMLSETDVTGLMEQINANLLALSTE